MERGSLLKTTSRWFLLLLLWKEGEAKGRDLLSGDLHAILYPFGDHRDDGGAPERIEVAASAI